MENGTVGWLLEHNGQQSRQFCSPGTRMWRQQYRALHPTEILAIKCMDGRINIPVMTNTPLGIIQPIRTMGGIIDIGVPFLNDFISDWVAYAIDRGRDCLILNTYHFSQGDVHRGCRGYNYDTALARESTRKLTCQFEEVFGKEYRVVYPIMIGIETDGDGFIFHGANGEALSIANHLNASEDDLRSMLCQLYPDMKPHMVNDLLPLAVGNRQHIQDIRLQARPITDVSHCESVLGFGRGFDWLHIPNKALIIGPYSFDLAKPIQAAARILWDNVNRPNSTISPEDLALLVLSSHRDEAGHELSLARQKALSMAKFAMQAIDQGAPEVAPFLRKNFVVGVVNSNTRLITRLEITP